MESASRFNIITFIGSMKYWDEFITEASRLHSEGNIVILPHKDPDEANMTDEKRRMYDRMIRDQIDMAEEVHVMNVNGYIGKSTATELQYAIQRGKTISYYDSSNREKIITLCGSFKFAGAFKSERDRLTLEGNVVLMPATFESGINMEDLSEDKIRHLHRIHYRKIEMSDEIHIICPGGYVGEDTQREIDYAESIGKKVVRLMGPSY